MRVFVAFIISLLIYALLIWLFVTKFSNVEVTPHKKNDHIVKIDIRNIPLPKAPIQPKPAPKKKKIEQAKPKIKPKKKPIIKKKPIKKQPIVKKKPHKKRVPKKKIIKKKVHKKKRVPKKKIIKKRPQKKHVHKKKPKIIKKKKPTKKKVPKEHESTKDMLYIPEPFITEPKSVETSDDLASFLSTPSQPKSASRSYPNRKIRKLYGSSFFNMTPTQKRFIEDNLDIIQEITQRTLTRRGYPEAAAQTGQEGTNVVSFNLHPNGDISNLHLKTRIGYRSLDENTLTLIRVAYKDYPYPKTTTKIVFYVTYTIYGY